MPVALMAWGALKPLQRRDFSLLWVALAVSLIGDGAWMVAIPWQVISSGAGTDELAIVVGSGSIGILVSLFGGGLLADLFPRRTVLATSALLAALIVLVLTLLTVAELLTVPILAVAAFALAALDGVTGPSVETLIPTLVSDDELQAAYGLEELLTSIAGRALGPAIGGGVVVLAGPVGAFAADSASFFIAAVLFCLLRGGRLPAMERQPGRGVGALLGHIREAGRFVRRHRWLWAGIGWAGLALLAQIGPRQVLLPFLVAGRLHGSAGDFGLLLASFGVCATIGALVAAGIPTPTRYLSAMFTAWALGSLPFAFLPFAGHLAVAAVALGMAGLFSAIGNVFWATLMQRRVPNELRGRVSSFDWFGTLSLIPVSMAVAGALGSSGTSITVAFLVAGIGPALLALVALFGLGLRRGDSMAPPVAVRDSAAEYRGAA